MNNESNEKLENVVWKCIQRILKNSWNWSRQKANSVRSKLPSRNVLLLIVVVTVIACTIIFSGLVALYETKPDAAKMLDITALNFGLVLTTIWYAILNEETRCFHKIIWFFPTVFSILLIFVPIFDMFVSHFVQKCLEYAWNCTLEGLDDAFNIWSLGFSILGIGAYIEKFAKKK
jgi:magnesium-transporting ATPase (P-type)